MRHARPDYDRIQDPAHLIPDGEPVFLLRAQDHVAADVVRYWGRMNELRGGDPELTQAAYRQADAMDAWPLKKAADYPAPADGTPVEE